MSKMSELDLAIKELHTVAEHLINIANSLTAIFSQPAESNIPGTSKQEKPKSEPTLTLEKVRGILADKSRNGFTGEIRELLEKYGGSKLSEISPERYADLLKEAEGLK